MLETSTRPTQIESRNHRRRVFPHAVTAETWACEKAADLLHFSFSSSSPLLSFCNRRNSSQILLNLDPLLVPLSISFIIRLPPFTLFRYQVRIFVLIALRWGNFWSCGVGLGIWNSDLRVSAVSFSFWYRLRFICFFLAFTGDTWDFVNSAQRLRLSNECSALSSL